jgi:hypothetical protein
MGTRTSFETVACLLAIPVTLSRAVTTLVDRVRNSRSSWVQDRVNSAEILGTGAIAPFFQPYIQRATAISKTANSAVLIRIVDSLGVRERGQG